MEFASVFHRTVDNYCYMLDENQLIINLKTGYDVKEVNIVYGDPFANGILGGGEEWTGEKANVPFKKRLKYQLWWTTTIKPAFKRLKYYFELVTETQSAGTILKMVLSVRNRCRSKGAADNVLRCRG